MIEQVQSSTISTSVSAPGTVKKVVKKVKKGKPALSAKEKKERNVSMIFFLDGVSDGVLLRLELMGLR